MKSAPSYYVFHTELHDHESLAGLDTNDVVPVVLREHHYQLAAENQELRTLLKSLQSAVAYGTMSVNQRAALMTRIDKLLED